MKHIQSFRYKYAAISHQGKVLAYTTVTARDFNQAYEEARQDISIRFHKQPLKISYLKLVKIS